MSYFHGAGKDLHRRGAWYWDTLDDKWVELNRAPRPGMTLLLKASGGCYDAEIGFDASSKNAVSAIPVTSARENAFPEDPESRQAIPVTLIDHLGHIARQMAQLCSEIDETTYAPVLRRTALWHDVGKAHEVHRTRCGLEEGDVSLAKFPNYNWRIKHESNRTIFRHELASMLAWLAQHEGEQDADLIAYIIAAHHGKVRMSLRAMPTEEPAPEGRRFARGVWEGDVLRLEQVTSLHRFSGGALSDVYTGIRYDGENNRWNAQVYLAISCQCALIKAYSSFENLGHP